MMSVRQKQPNSLPLSFKRDMVTWLRQNMAPKVTADAFQDSYGDLVGTEFTEHATARTLQVALAKRKPPIVASYWNASRNWLERHKADSVPRISKEIW